MKSEGQRGREGRWLRDVRKARGYSNATKARDALERMTGHSIHYSAWAAYEAGSRAIGDQHLAWLEEFFGPIPDEPAHESGDLAGAIRQQAAAIDRLAAALEADREDGPPWAEALARILGATLRGSHSGGSDEQQGSGALRRGQAA